MPHSPRSLGARVANYQAEVQAGESCAWHRTAPSGLWSTSETQGLLRPCLTTTSERRLTGSRFSFNQASIPSTLSRRWRAARSHSRPRNSR